MPLPVIAFVTGAPYRLSPEGDRFVSKRKRVKPARSLMWLAGFADSRVKVIGVLYYSLVKEHRKPTEKAPSLVQGKKVRGLQPKILIFYKIFYFGTDFSDSLTDRLLADSKFLRKDSLRNLLIEVLIYQFFFLVA